MNFFDEWAWSNWGEERRYMTTPTRSLLRYHGGKWRIAPWIIAHFPEHRIYVEPFGGGGSTLLRKPRSHAEIYNDLDGELVNLFRVVRDRGNELERALHLTPFARSEYELAREKCTCELERARRMVVKSFMGHGSDAMRRKSGFRRSSKRSNPASHDWASYPDALSAIVERLRGVIIENRSAIDVIRQHDGPETLHYLDPPYVHATRERKRGYNHEMTDRDHGELAEVAHSLKGMVIVSGYPSALYDELYAGWRSRTKSALADGAKKTTEKLWISPNVRTQLDLFERSEEVSA